MNSFYMGTLYMYPLYTHSLGCVSLCAFIFSVKKSLGSNKMQFPYMMSASLLLIMNSKLRNFFFLQNMARLKIYVVF